jgi:hypothetical protein
MEYLGYLDICDIWEICGDIDTTSNANRVYLGRAYNFLFYQAVTRIATLRDADAVSFSHSSTPTVFHLSSANHIKTNSISVVEFDSVSWQSNRRPTDPVTIPLRLSYNVRDWNWMLEDVRRVTVYNGIERSPCRISGTAKLCSPIHYGRKWTFQIIASPQNLAHHSAILGY